MAVFALFNEFLVLRLLHIACIILAASWYFYIKKMIRCCTLFINLVYHPQKMKTIQAILAQII